MFTDLACQFTFLALCEAFPMSGHHFNREFRTRLAHFFSETLTGLRPHAETWQTWPIEHLLPALVKSSDNGQTSGTGNVAQKIEQGAAAVQGMDSTAAPRSRASTGTTRRTASRHSRRKSAKSGVSSSHGHSGKDSGRLASWKSGGSSHVL